MGINVAYPHLMNRRHCWLLEQASGEGTGRQEQVLNSFPRNDHDILHREQPGSLEILP